MIPRLLVLSGSTRPEAPETRLAAEATRLLSLSDSALTALSLADYPLPLFEAAAQGAAGGDTGNGGGGSSGGGMPENAWLLAQRLALQDGLLLVAATHNGGLPVLLKNALDWIAAAAARENRPLDPFGRLVVALALASPGGGERNDGDPAALAQLRQVLAHLGAEVMSAEFHLRDAARTLAPSGAPREAADRERLDGFLDRFLDHAAALGRRG